MLKLWPQGADLSDVEVKARDLVKRRELRMTALRRHALAIGMLIDDVEPEDLGYCKPGDVVQIVTGHVHANALLRVTEIRDQDRLQGYLLAASYRWRTGMRLSDVSLGMVRRVGHAPGAVTLAEYPLQEQRPLSFEQAAEAARLGYIAADQERRERRAKAARNRRAETKLLKQWEGENLRHEGTRREPKILP